MHSGPGIGKIFGVSISLDWSWGLILPLVAWQLASAIFPGWYPEWDPRLTWGVALAASLILFASVLAHDLAHLVAAKAKRIPIHHITLFLFGSVPDMGPELTSPAGEFSLAIAGPAASLALGGIFAFLGLGRATASDEFWSNPARTVAGLDPVSVLLFFAAAANIFVGALNLIPGFPLDGGRVLRSALWAATGDLRWATHWACRSGQLSACGLVAAGLVVLGVRPALSEVSWLGGLWLGLSGWLLNNAATMSHHLLNVEGLLSAVPGLQLLGARVPTVPPNIPVGNLVDDYISEAGDHIFPVIENGHLVGLVSSQDVCRVPREQWDTTEVGEIMISSCRVAVARPRRAGIDTIHGLTHLPFNPLAVELAQSSGQEND